MASFRILNPSTNPVLLQKGTVVGQFSKCIQTTLSYRLNQSYLLLLSIRLHIVKRKTSCPVSLVYHDSSALDSSENSQLNSLLESFEDIFAPSSLDLGYTSVVQHEIDMGTSMPSKQAPYRVSQEQ